jgi:sec-independent protein translocase protein TatB
VNVSPEKLLVVGIIALIVLGPNRLPEAARTVGRFVATFRHLSSDFQAEMRHTLAEPTEAFKAATGDFRPPQIRPPNVKRSIREAVGSAVSPPPSPAGERSERNASAPADPPGSPDESPPVAFPDDPSVN